MSMRIEMDCEKFEGDNEKIDSTAELSIEENDLQIAIEIDDNAYFFNKGEFSRAVRALCEEGK